MSWGLGKGQRQKRSICRSPFHAPPRPQKGRKSSTGYTSNLLPHLEASRRPASLPEPQSQTASKHAGATAGIPWTGRVFGPLGLAAFLSLAPPSRTHACGPRTPFRRPASRPAAAAGSPVTGWPYLRQHRTQARGSGQLTRHPRSAPARSLFEGLIVCT